MNKYIQSQYEMFTLYRVVVTSIYSKVVGLPRIIYWFSAIQIDFHAQFGMMTIILSHETQESTVSVH